MYEIASGADRDWKKDWPRLDKISEAFWFESYPLDTTDPFAEELEQMILTGLQKAGVDTNQLHELISPAQATVPQRMEMDLKQVRDGALTPAAYARQYWYRLGTWNGGTLFTEKELSKEVVGHPHHTEDLSTLLVQRQQLHQENDAKLDAATYKLVHLIRTLTLWREERKAVLQKMSIGLNRVLDKAAAELNVNHHVLAYSAYNEALKGPEHIATWQARQKCNVLITNPPKGIQENLVGLEAEAVLQAFAVNERQTTFKGTVASKGKATGAVRVILRAQEFHRFQEGEVLVTTMTRPEYVPLMKKAAAIITDEGGLTSHAAIVSRELKKPCVIGTKIATQTLRDGDQVEVDAEKGIVSIVH